MERTATHTDSAPAAIGPYSQAVVAEHFVFTSGQIALDPKTGEMVGGGDVEAETRQVLDNLDAVLRASHASFASIVKTTIFLADMNDFAAVNRIYAERFEAAPPARATVQVARLPKDARVEIEAIALVA
jgi:2-iminobutanoate/2-iminopropanoate deaminase